MGKAGKLFHLIRVLKIFRIFKLVRHLASLQSLLTTLRQANKELGLLAVLAGFAVLIFATLIYYAEKDVQKWSFMDSLLYSLLTLTTVG